MIKQDRELLEKDKFGSIFRIDIWQLFQIMEHLNLNLTIFQYCEDEKMDLPIVPEKNKFIFYFT